ncbi:hypothetical protein JQ597_25280 [Bradyrhizobium sp. AUGA SZCCT0177]|uniref:hypothetical protein n=1 Tax=Bradyrhizobium sp. AUGA SZCCT0177 TaxID=2807665 RepID=UPI001BA71F63|nr:hypothetical protein [Bradyrhizobium sp. AUGA SZCCT0177]MBR1285367.1 hypothetical protein [Bradyrhizobium sp. AUGA SZCCT0177]
MWSATKEPAGWKVGEAIRRCADPVLLSRWFANHRSWRAAGSRTRFIFLSEQIDGIEAVRHNARERTSRALFAQNKQSYAQVKRSLFEHLLAGRLVAWGQRESPLAEAICIPSQSWKYLQIKVGQSIAIENTQAKTKIFDVRIFPMIESPDAIDRIDGKTLVEAFQMAVVSDPQLTVLRKRALAVHAQPASFGYEWGPYRAVWPVGFSRGPKTGAVALLQKFDEPLRHNGEHPADRVLAVRFGKLMQFLSDGRLVAEGIPKGGGGSIPIPRLIWQRDRTYIDLENGDLLEIDQRAEDGTTALSSPIFTGLMLFKPDGASRIPESPKVNVLFPARTQEVAVATREIITKTTSQAACHRWLWEHMRASPDRRPKPKGEYWQDAQKNWPRTLSKRAFDKEWDKAIETAEANKWSKGGRPRKPPQSKPPHQ